MRILLVDDHPIVRKGLKSLLEEQPGFIVISEAGNGADAVSLFRSLKPDVGIVDLKLPDMSGIDVAVEAKRHSSLTRAIILSMHTNDFYVEQAFQKGADGYVFKDALEHDIVNAICSVVNGIRYVSGVSSAPSLRDPIQCREAGPLADLTNREKEIFHLIVQGEQNKEIAQHLSIGVRTVETHRARIMHKLRVRSSAEIMHYAFSHKMINLP